VDEALALAVLAPSNSNIQPWHVVFASGPPRDRLVKALVDEAKRRPPNIPPLPEAFKRFRSELGAQVYGAMGIARDDKVHHDEAVLRNWEFFRAPLGGIVCMHNDLGPADALSVGMFLQTLLLALTARGLGTCVEVSIAGYPEIVREQSLLGAASRPAYRAWPRWGRTGSANSRRSRHPWAPPSRGRGTFRRCGRPLPAPAVPRGPLA
jgi:hypothetical protein